MSGPPAFDGRARKLRAAYRFGGPEGGSPGGRGGRGRGGPRLAPPLQLFGEFAQFGRIEGAFAFEVYR